MTHSIDRKPLWMMNFASSGKRTVWSLLPRRGGRCRESSHPSIPMMRRLVSAAVFVLATAAPLGAQGGAPAVPRVSASDRDLMMEAARTAWAYVDAQYQAETGLVNSVENYPFATVWDIGSGLAALYAAEALGLLPTAEYDRRMRRALATLRETGIFDGGAFNKNYSTATGRMAGRNADEASGAERGYGWSAIDVGRLLVWLHIIRTTQPRFADDARAVAARIDFGRLVENGYMMGEDISPRGRPRRYQEGRIGYEQYAATGFALWGHPPERALRIGENAYPVDVQGVALVGDRRGDDILTSEPFVMMGLETGWTPEARDLAWRVLAAQEARFRQTGRVTVVNEDAVTGPPYFLYYSVYGAGEPFRVAAPDGAPAGPLRPTVSTKGAYGWHALLPGLYTWRAIQAVQGARTERGWGAGVFEENLRISGAPNVNTAAVVLEAALYVVRGRPLVEGAAPAP